MPPPDGQISKFFERGEQGMAKQASNAFREWDSHTDWRYQSGEANESGKDESLLLVGWIALLIIQPPTLPGTSGRRYSVSVCQEYGACLL